MSADPLVAFWTARLDENEATAKRAAACALVQRDGYEPGDWRWLRSYGQPQPEQIALIDHQSQFDPARVLREVEAKRAILARYVAVQAWSYPPGDGDEAVQDELGEIIRRLVAVESDHPDYRPEWAPSSGVTLP